MEPPAKRARGGPAPYDDDDDDEEANDDELSLSASQFAARQDPMYKLDKRRAKAHFRLKSRFEHIFEKYGKDFGGVGDEIDLRTGELVVDNGHLQSLEDHDEKEDSSGGEEGEEPIVHERSDHSDALAPGKPTPYNTASPLHDGWQQPPGLRSDFSLAPQLFGGPPTVSPGWMDSTWQVPNIGPEAVESGPSDIPSHQEVINPVLLSQNFGRRFGLLHALGHLPYGRLATAKDVAPRSLSTLEASGDDEWEIAEVPNKVTLTGTKDGTKSTDIAASVKQASEKAADISLNSIEPTDRVPETSKDQPSRPRGRPRKDRLANATAVRLTEAASTRHDGQYIPGVVLLPGEVSDLQGRKSLRMRRQPEFYGQLKWMKTRQKKPSLDHSGTEMVREPSTSSSEEALPSTSQYECSANLVGESIMVSGATPDLQDDGVEPTTALPSGSDNLLDQHATVRSSNQTVADSQVPSSSLTKQTIADSQAPTSSLPQAQPQNAPEVQQARPRPTVATVVGETFVRNDIDPSYAFSDEEDFGLVQQPAVYIPVAPEVVVIDEAEPISPLSNTAISKPAIDQTAIVNVGHEAASKVGNPKSSQEPDTLEMNNTDQTPQDFVEPALTDVSGEPGLNTEGSASALPSSRTTPSRVLADCQEPWTSQEIVAVQVPNLSGTITEGPQDDVPQEQTPMLPRPDDSSKGLLMGHQASYSESGLEVRPPLPSLKKSPQTPQKSRSVSQGPSSAKAKARRGVLTKSAKKSALASLLADSPENEDDLSILSSSGAFTPSSFRESLSRVSPSQSKMSTPPRRSRKHSLLIAGARGENRSRAGTPSSSRPGGANSDYNPRDRWPGGSGSHQSTPARGSGFLHTSPLTRTALENNAALLSTPRKSRARSPTDSLVRTPGGTMRRCGEDGFECDRDFCLTCCK